MNQKLMDCFTNPIKCKILLEIQTQGTATAKQLAQTLSDISQATLYRYLKKMTADKILKVVDEIPVRAVIEKVYAPGFDLQADTQAMLEQNSGAAYMQLFQQFTLGLLREFQEYTAKKDIDILNDISTFASCPVYATAQELQDFMMKLGALLEQLRSNQAAPGRKAHSIVTVITPPKNIE